MNLTELHKKFGTQDKCIAYHENSVKDEKCMLNYKPKGDTKQIAYGKRKTNKCLS